MALPGVYKMFNDRWCNQTVWIISDTHFGDKDLRAKIRNRPSDDELVRRINAKVGRKDTLICLGDVGDIEFVKKLRGYKVLICGNHDVGHTVYEEVFDEVYSGPLMIGEKLLLSHEPIPGITWAMNLHGHVHSKHAKTDEYHKNFCSDVIGYQPFHLTNWLQKCGPTAHIDSIHRITIDEATERKKKRGGKKHERKL